MLLTGPLLGVEGSNFMILLGVGAFTRPSLKSLRTTTGGLYKDETLSCETPVFPLIVPYLVFPLVVPFEVLSEVFGEPMAFAFKGISSALPSSVKSTAYFFEINLRFGQH